MPCLNFWNYPQKTLENKPKRIKSIRRKPDDVPGKKTSMDHPVSAKPGVILQMSGFLTNLMINGGTMFVDHYFGHIYVFLIKNLALEETLYAKEAYEIFLQSVGVLAQVYHADNGRFGDKDFIDACESS